MHDMDRTRAELESGLDALEGTGFEFEADGSSEFEGETFGEFEGESHGGSGHGGPAFNEMQEMELAAELLEVTNEQELNQFIGGLIRRVGRAAGQVVRGPSGQALAPVLRQAARTLLPAAGAALGNLVAPGVGGAVGGRLASAAGKALGLELEGLSGEDREFEVARRYVRFAGATTRGTLRMPPRIPPRRAAQVAARAAARRHAPGLVRAPWLAAGQGLTVNVDGGYAADSDVFGGASANGTAVAHAQQGAGDGDEAAFGGAGAVYGGGARSGRWFRRGRRIVLVGI